MPYHTYNVRKIFTLTGYLTILTIQKLAQSQTNIEYFNIMLQRSHKILLLLNILYLVLVKFSQLNGSSFCLILQSTQEKNRISSEMNELRDHLDIKDRKISVLQRKVRAKIQFCCKFNNFCNFENPRLRIWRIF